MNMNDVMKLEHGLYRVFWKDEDGEPNGSSLAAVGSMHSGMRWMAPTNWTREDGLDGSPGTHESAYWLSVDHMELIQGY